MTNRLNAMLFALLAFPLAPVDGSVISGGSANDLNNSVHCLANDPVQMLGPRNTNPISVIVSRDDLSLPTEHHLWVFVQRNHGVYDVFDEEIKGGAQKRYVLRNNGSIKWDGRNVNDFEPLLGGVLSHSVMVKNFMEALKSKPIVMRPFAAIRERIICESYASPRRFH